MRRQALAVGWATVGLASGAPAYAQIEGALPLPVETPLLLPAAGGGAVTTFYFVGIPGEQRTIEATLAGDVELELYDADGIRLMRRSVGAAGTGRVFDFIPPYAETYLLVMTRPGPPVPVTVKSTVTAPTLQQAIMATGVGYEFTSEYGTSWSCWSEQGIEVKQFGTIRDGTAFSHRLRIAPDSNSQQTYTMIGSIRSESTARNWIEGDSRVTSVTIGGKTTTTRIRLDAAMFLWPAGQMRKWRTYTCPP